MIRGDWIDVMSQFGYIFVYQFSFWTGLDQPLRLALAVG
jgi:hypothetical protein